MIRYRIKAAWRLLVYVGLRRLLNYREYTERENVGYLGWYEIGGRVIAFKRMDGRNQFLW